MLTYLLIFLAILSIVGPAFLLLPSRRQREQMALRASARKRGMQVELARIEDPDPDPAKYRTLSGKLLPMVVGCVALSRHRRRERQWQERPAPPWQVIRTQSAPDPGLPPGWRWQTGDPALLSRQLRALLQSEVGELPDDVLAVGEQQLRLTVYWQERSGEEGLARVEELMTRLLSVPLMDPEEQAEEQ